MATEEDFIPSIAPIIALQLQIRQHQRYVGVAAKVTPSSKQVANALYLYEFLDSDQFSNLDSLLVQLGPSEIFLEVPGNDEAIKGDLSKILDIAERHSIEHKMVPKGKFRPGDIESSLRVLLGEQSLVKYQQQLEMKLAISALSCLISELGFVESTESGSLQYAGKCSLENGTLESCMMLDSAAAEAVNLLPDPSHPNKYGSVFGVLNHCKTKMGERLLMSWLRQPLLDIAEIERRQSMVSALVTASSVRGQLQDNALKGIPDIETLLAKLKKGKATLRDIFKLYVFVLNMPKCAEAFDLMASATQESVKLKEHFLSQLEGCQENFSMFLQLVEAVLDTSVFPDLIINPRYDERLAELSDDLEAVKGEIEEMHEEANRGWSQIKKNLDIKLDSDKVRGFVFRITKPNVEQDLRKWNPDIHVCDVKKNGILFTTPDLKKSGKQYKELKAEYEEAQAVLVAKAAETSLTYLPVFEDAARTIMELDVLVALAHTAALAPNGYCRPKLLPKGTGKLVVQQARHPCVELQDNVNFIPNDYDLCRDKTAFTIITGPNMGGKSTYIRALGSIVVMAQMGSYVPCASAEISIVDRILARVGAGDAQHKGVSTFMAEMLEASAILQTASENSLLIIDELGRGTSTFDGFGIAWAISEHIVRNIKCPTLFATHFHELTALEDREASVKNKHVSAHVEGGQITFLYETRPGPCLESFGIHVAEMAHFPPSVIASAKRKASELENFKGLEEGFRQNKKRKPESLKPMVQKFSGLPLDLMSSTERIKATLEVFQSLL